MESRVAEFSGVRKAVIAERLDSLSEDELRGLCRELSLEKYCNAIYTRTKIQDLLLSQLYTRTLLDAIPLARLMDAAQVILDAKLESSREVVTWFVDLAEEAKKGTSAASLVAHTKSGLALLDQLAQDTGARVALHKDSQLLRATMTFLGCQTGWLQTVLGDSSLTEGQQQKLARLELYCKVLQR